MKKDQKRYMEDAVLKAVREVVAYLWEDEGKHYRELEGDEREGHIYESVELLAGWLEYQKTAKREEQRVATLVVLLFAAVLMFLPELISYFE